MTTYTRFNYGRTSTYYAKKAYTIKNVSTTKNVSTNAWTKKRLREEMSAYLKGNADK